MSRSVSYVAPERGGGGGGSGAGKAHNSVDTHSGPTTALLLGDPTESEFGDEYRRFDRSRSGSVALPRRRLVSSAVRQQSLATGEGADPEVIEPPLSWKAIFLYTVPNIPRGAITKWGENWSSLFFANVLHVPLTGLSLFNTAQTLLGFLAAPLVAWLSDNTPTRFGRRKWIIAASTPFALISFFMSTWAPMGVSTKFLLGWFIASTMIGVLDVSVGMNNAWGAELSKRSDQRVRLYSWSGVLSYIGNMLGTALPPLLVHLAGGAIRPVYMWFGLALVVTYAITYTILLWFLPERDDSVPDNAPSLVPAFIDSWNNVPYRRYVLLAMVARLGPSGISGYVYILVFKTLFNLSSVQVSAALFAHYIAGAVGSWFWMWLGKCVENRTGYIIAHVMCIMLADVLVLCNMFEQSIAFPVALLIGWLNGMGYSGAGIFTGAIYADCMEYDELYSGKRREAQYDATWRIFGGIASVFFSGIPFAAFASVGYKEGAKVQPAGVATVLQGLIVLNAVVDLSQLAIIWGYNITRRKHTAIVMAIDAVRSGEPDVVDPLYTNRLVRPPAARKAVMPPQLWAALSHFWRWEIKLAAGGGRGSRRSCSPSLLTQVAVELSISIAMVVASCIIAAPFYKSSKLFIIFTLLMNVFVVGTGIVCYSGLRLLPALRLHARGHEDERRLLLAYLHETAPRLVSRKAPLHDVVGAGGEGTLQRATQLSSTNAGGGGGGGK